MLMEYHYFHSLPPILAFVVLDRFKGFHAIIKVKDVAHERFNINHFTINHSNSFFKAISGVSNSPCKIASFSARTLNIILPNRAIPRTSICFKTSSIIGMFEVSDVVIPTCTSNFYKSAWSASVFFRSIKHRDLQQPPGRHRINPICIHSSAPEASIQMSKPRSNFGTSLRIFLATLLE